MRFLLPLALLCAGCLSTRKAWHAEPATFDTTRTLSMGKVVGGDGNSRSHAWLGLPFAAPPVGELRWRAPQKPAPWSEPRAATRFGAPCLQPSNELAAREFHHGDVTGSEDCLTLNVWTPRFAEVPKGSKRLPVMVWIHGGGNSIGTASAYDLGELSTSQGVVAISVQYRLGPFGWLRHAALREGATPEEASGNFGVLDLVAALKFIRDEVSAFGGDPNNVTIFGESAGGQNVYALLLSPQAKGLFHRAIAQSPVLLRTTLAQAEHFTDDAEPGHARSSNEVLAALLVETKTSPDRAAAKAKLALMSAAEIATWWRARSASEVLGIYTAQGASPTRMLDAPLVFGDGVVLPPAPWTDHFARADGWNRVPLVAGTTRDEGKLFLALSPEYTWRIFGLLPRVRSWPRYEAASGAFSRLWRAGAVDEVLRAVRASGHTDAWSYRFDYDDWPTILGQDLGRLLGAAHGLDVPFVLGREDGPLQFLQRDGRAHHRQALSRAMMNYWGEVARTGQPGSGGDPGAPVWPRFTEEAGAPKGLRFDGPPQGLSLLVESESPEGVLKDVVADERLGEKLERCQAVQRMKAMRFVSDARFDAVVQCPAVP